MRHPAGVISRVPRKKPFGDAIASTSSGRNVETILMLRPEPPLTAQRRGDIDPPRVQGDLRPCSQTGANQEFIGQMPSLSEKVAEND
jgi:hypothetical protein